MKQFTILGCAALALAACAQRPADTAYLAGTLHNYEGKGYALLINSDTIGDAVYDTIDVQADGTFLMPVKTTKNVERGLYLEYLGDNRGVINCYLKPGDTLRVDVTGGMKEETLFGETMTRYVSTPVFNGSTCVESEYLNLPSYYDYKYKNDDGSQVSFKDYMAQIEAQQAFRRGKLEGACPEFVAEQTPAIDGLKTQYSFVYARRLQIDGNHPEQDTDFMAYVNSIDLNDEANMAGGGQSTTTGDAVSFKLSIQPDLYKGEPQDARFYCFLRDSIQNPVVRETLADDRMHIYLAMGTNSDLQRLFEVYRTVSGTSERFKENEKVYNNLARLLPGVKATDFEMQDVDGNTVRFLDVIGQGKVTYIDFWATWCGPCCAEIPFVEKLVEKYKNNPKIEFLSISLDKDLKKWHEKLDRDKPTWRQYVIPDNFESAFAKEYNITAIPRFMVFDGEGRIITINAERPSAPNIVQVIDGYLE